MGDFSMTDSQFIFYFYVFPYLWGYGHWWLMLLTDGAPILLLAVLIRKFIRWEVRDERS